MNNQRREKIRTLAGQLSDLQSEIETVLEEEQEYFDNIPENLQQGERYSTSEAAISNLEEAKDAIETAANALESAME